jgi:hypothetical protein
LWSIPFKAHQKKIKGRILWTNPRKNLIHKKMKKLLNFVTILLFLASISCSEETINSKDDFDSFILDTHTYTDDSHTGAVEVVNFKLLNEKGVSHFNLKKSDLKEDEQFAIMEIQVRESIVDKSSNFKANLGNEFFNDGRIYDRDKSDLVYTSIKIGRYKSLEETVSAGRTNKFKIGCTSVDVIYNGDKCGPTYTCSDWLGWCLCMSGCSWSYESN